MISLKLLPSVSMIVRVESTDATKQEAAKNAKTKLTCSNENSFIAMKTKETITFPAQFAVMLADNPRPLRISDV